MSALACTVEPFAGRASPTVALPAGRPSRVDANPACSSCHGLSLWQALRRRPDPMSVTKITTVGRATEALSPGRCRCDLSVLHGTGVTHQRPARQLRAVHASSSFSDKMAMPVCFRFGGGCREQRVRALSVQPCRHLGVGVRHHQFGHDVGVENEHGCRPWSNCGGSRTGSLGGISSSTPPNGLNSSCIAVPRFLVGTASSPSAVRRISRTSCSMECPFSAARIHSRLFRPSSKLRTMILTIMQRPLELSRQYYVVALQLPSRICPSVVGLVRTGGRHL